MRTGHAVSPHFRFLTSSGDWVWMQLEATLRYKNGTKIPQFWEVKCRVLRYSHRYFSINVLCWLVVQWKGSGSPQKLGFR